MSKKVEAFKLFDEGKKPNSDEVKALGLNEGTRYGYYGEWLGLKREHIDEPEDIPFKISGEIDIGEECQKVREEAHQAELEALKLKFQNQLDELAGMLEPNINKFNLPPPLSNAEKHPGLIIAKAIADNPEALIATAYLARNLLRSFGIRLF